MKVVVRAEFQRIRAGVEARCSALRLSGHGRDTKDATESLRRGILAWCVGLEQAGELEQALKRRGLEWEKDGNGLVVVVKHPDTSHIDQSEPWADVHRPIET